MSQDPFEEYRQETEPGKQERYRAWRTAIGLQAVDSLEPSPYLIETAKRHIEGEIDIDEVKRLLDSYYEEIPSGGEARAKEADIVSARIEEILNEKSFTLSPVQYLSVHKRLFQGILPHAGQFRDFNITKKEWVLDGASVIYGNALSLSANLDYDLSEEKKFSYRNLTMTEIIRHLSRFVAALWQNHIFAEGNTRATAVFFIQYLRTLGFQTDNEPFAEHSRYFRNALVRANYNDLQNGIHETTEYLERFLENLLLGRKNELHNREMHISGLLGKQPDMLRDEAGFPFDSALAEHHILPKTAAHIRQLFQAFDGDRIFGRAEIMQELGLTPSPASALIGKMQDAGIVIPVTGFGKGKMRFI